MQYVPSSTVTLSATLAHHPHPHPDDTNVQTSLPQICVDYLSHEWEEEDVWKSWRNMTRHKNEVANGIRLENASWRTWWKQRNKLRTISPETLNWLKDSDVTWLYGPLHTAANPIPPPRISTTEERFNLLSATGKKPILKRRTISDMLNIPLPDQIGNRTGTPVLEAVNTDSDESSSLERPPIYHTKSDTNILTRTSSRRISPPRASDFGENAETKIASRENSLSLSPRSGTPMSEGTSSGKASSGVVIPSAKKHISFNNYVEQCISIDEPIKVSSLVTSSSGGSDSDDEASSSPLPDLDSHATQPEIVRPPFSRSGSHHSDHVTIVPIPPTLLKTSEEYPAPSPAIVYVPSPRSNYTYVASPESPTSESSDEDAEPEIDFTFVAPQWGRPAVPPPAVTIVGTGPLGSAGPGGLFNSIISKQPPAPPSQPTVTYDSHEHYSRAIASHHQAGMNEGRSKWVAPTTIDEDEDDDEKEADEEAESSEEVESDDEDSEEGQQSGFFKVMSPKSSTRATASSPSTSYDYFNGPDLGVGDEYSSGKPSSDSTRRSGLASPGSTDATSPSHRSRFAPQPGRGILKNASDSPERTYRAATTAPIGIPHVVGSPQSGADAVIGGLPGSPAQPSFMHPGSAALSASPQHVNSLGPPSSSHFRDPAVSSSSLLQGSTRRGRSAQRTSPSLSDRSRSSSKNETGSLHASPIGSVSPTGYGSPGGSRATSVAVGSGSASVVARRYSAADSGMAIAGVGGRGREPREGRPGEVRHAARPNSLSPPVIGAGSGYGAYAAPATGYRPSGLGSPPTNAPVPSPAVVTSQPVTSSPSSPTKSPASPPHQSTQPFRIPSTPPPTSKTHSSSLSPVSKKSGGSPPKSFKNKIPPNGVKPTVVISRDASVIGGGPVTSGESLGSPDVGEEESKARKRDDYWADKPSNSSSSSTRQPSVETVPNGLLNGHQRRRSSGDATTISSVTMKSASTAQTSVNGTTGSCSSDEDERFYSTNPTPSNSPVFGIKSLNKGTTGSASTPSGKLIAPSSLPSSSTPTKPVSDSAPRIYSPSSKGPPSNATSPASATAQLPIRTPTSPGAAGGAIHLGSSANGSADPEGGIVGKAVDIVSSARGLLGAIWNAGTVRGSGSTE